MWPSALLLAALAAWLTPLSHAHGSHAHGSHHHQGVDPPPHHGAAPLTPSAVRFPLSAITLDPASALFTSRARNARYMLSLDSARLTCLFTAAANLTGTFAQPTCQPYDHPQYFGHYFGHYLSAVAIYLEGAGVAASPAGAAMAAKLEVLLDAVEAVQGAWGAAGQRGFFYPYSPTSFDTLEAGRNCDPVCVPYYVLHKSLAGLLDLATRLGSARARAAAVALGDWVVARVAGVLAAGGQAQWQAVLGTEWGGMNDGLSNLYRLTGNASYLATAYAFNHWAWTAPLVVHEDALQNFHANTHLPEILGDLNGFALTQNATQAAIVGNFLDILLANHSWATGGSNEGEWWHAPRTMAQQLDQNTEETCTQYNVVKITSAWGDLWGDAAWYDWAEKQLLNGLLGNQNLGGRWEGTDSVGMHYMLPLGGAGLRKPWGDSAQGFPCCWGTSTEQFAGRHLELAFAHSPDNAVLYANLMLPVTLAWAARGGLTVAAEVGFPASTTSSLRLTFGGGSGRAQAFTLALRIPGWTAGAPVLTLNGAPLPPAAASTLTPGAYANITRQWASGDVLDAYFPAALSWEGVVDDSPAAARTGALLFGPVLLAGVNASTDLLPGKDISNPAAWVARVPDERSLRFTLQTSGGYCAGGGGGGGGGAVTLPLMPLMDVKDEAYTVYWHAPAALPPPQGFSGSATLPLDTSAAAWEALGGASLVGSVIRSGDPGQTNVAALQALIQDASHAIAGAAFTYTYNVGYGPAGRQLGTNFSVALVDACSADASRPRVLGVLYQSPDLVAPAYDACSDCYSAPVAVRVALPAGSEVPVTGVSRVAFLFNDNDRNLQLPTGFNVRGAARPCQRPPQHTHSACFKLSYPTHGGTHDTNFPSRCSSR